MIKRVGIIVLLGVIGCLALVGCKRTKPQAPANRYVQVDSTELAMALMTQRMVEEANNTLAQYVRRLDSAYALAQRGYWYRITQHTANDTIRKNQQVLAHIVVQDLQGQLLTDSEQSLIVGQQILPADVEAFLLQMCIGERASLLLPWYVAYGALGNEWVPAYANVRMEIEIIE